MRSRGLLIALVVMIFQPALMLPDRRALAHMSGVRPLRGAGFPSRADFSPADGTWLVGDKVAIESFDCAGLLCGRIVWLRRPDLRTPAMCGRTIVWGLTPAGPSQWTGGTFFDPENSETYDITADLQSDGTISARIYDGVALFGRTEVLRRIAPRSLAGWC